MKQKYDGGFVVRQSGQGILSIFKEREVRGGCNEGGVTRGDAAQGFADMVRILAFILSEMLKVEEFETLSKYSDLHF